MYIYVAQIRYLWHKMIHFASVPILISFFMLKGVWSSRWHHYTGGVKKVPEELSSEGRTIGDHLH